MLMFDNELQAVRDASGFTDEELIMLENEFEKAYDESQTILNTIDTLWEFQDDLSSMSRRDKFRDALVLAGERNFVSVLSGISQTQVELNRAVADETERYFQSLDTLESIVHECVKNGILHELAPWELSNGRMFTSATRLLQLRDKFQAIINAREGQNND